MKHDWPPQRRCDWRLHFVRPVGLFGLRQRVPLKCTVCWDVLDFDVHRAWPWERAKQTAREARDDAEAQALDLLPAWAAGRLCRRNLRSL